MNHKLLKERRLANGLTQEVMARSLGYKDKSSYSLIENGRTSVNIEIANKIAQILNLSNSQKVEIFFDDKV